MDSYKLDTFGGWVENFPKQFSIDIPCTVEFQSNSIDGVLKVSESPRIITFRESAEAYAVPGFIDALFVGSFDKLVISESFNATNNYNPLPCVVTSESITSLNTKAEGRIISLSLNGLDVKDTSGIIEIELSRLELPFEFGTRKLIEDQKSESK